MEFPNWFVPFAQRIFDKHLSPLAGTRGLRFLQIGAFTGDASVWLCRNVLTAPGCWLFDVDTWNGSDEHDGIDFRAVEAEYDRKTRDLPIRKYKQPSFDYLRAYLGQPFDFVYIDGDHTAQAVLADAVLAIPLLKRGGLLAFDDYRWQARRGIMHSPGPAIDAVSKIYADRLEQLELGPQAWFRIR